METKKLELKHLAAYLPYGLNCKTINEYESENIQLLIGCNFRTLTAIFKDNNSYQFEGFSVNNIKPILHPLSDLTNEIELNGKKFLPLEKIFGKKIERDVLFEKMQVEHFLKSGLSRFVEYQYITILLSWNFDIFGLIDAGLAIDINTLKTPENGNINI